MGTNVAKKRPRSYEANDGDADDQGEVEAPLKKKVKIEPRKEASGKPRSRAPFGKAWSSELGNYVDESEAQMKPKKRVKISPRKKVSVSDIDDDDDDDDMLDEDFDDDDGCGNSPDLDGQFPGDGYLGGSSGGDVEMVDSDGDQDDAEGRDLEETMDMSDDDDAMDVDIEGKSL